MKRKSIALIGICLILIFMVGCKPKPLIEQNTKEGAQAFAEKFGRLQEQKDYENMYDMFIPELQTIKGKEDFVNTMEYLNSKSSSDLTSYRLDSISMESQNEAYAYFTISVSAISSKAPAMKLEYKNGRWGVNAYVDIFATDVLSAKLIDDIPTCTTNLYLIEADSRYHLELFSTGNEYYDILSFDCNRYDFTDSCFNILFKTQLPKAFKERFNMTSNFILNENYLSFFNAFKALCTCQANSDKKNALIGYPNCIEQKNILESDRAEFDKNIDGMGSLAEVIDIKKMIKYNNGTYS